MPSHRALHHVSRGLLAPVQPGEEIPDTFMDSLGNEQPYDFERLVDLGAAEKITKGARKPEPSEPEPSADAEPE